MAPLRPPARMELGRAHSQWARYRGGRNEDPRAELQKAIEIFQDLGRGPGARDYDVHLQLGLAFKVWANYEEQIGEDTSANLERALTSLREATRIDERPFDAWINLGSTYAMRAESAQAKDPEGDAQQALAALDRARAARPKDVASFYHAGKVHRLLAGRTRARGGDPRPELSAARALYRQGLEINPGLGYIHHGLGATSLEEADATWDRGGDPGPLLDEARTAFAAAVAAAPDQGVGHHNVGEALLRRVMLRCARGEDPGDAAREAVTAIQQAVDRLAQHALPWANLGTVHSLLASAAVEQGRDPTASLTAASAALGEALKRNPENAQAQLYLGETMGVRARWEAGKGSFRAADFEHAAEAYQKALEKAPDHHDHAIAFAHFCRAWAVAARTGGQDGSVPLTRGLSEIERVLRARPGLPDAELARGRLRLAQAEAASAPAERRALAARALEDFTRALAGNPSLERRYRPEVTLARRLAAPAG